jgi:uncharacterized protein RhaS with RHS repeats
VTQRTAPRSHADSYIYDLMGNLTQATDRRGKITTYCYDSLNRRSLVGFGTITTPGACAAGSNYESTIAYTYDKGDRLLRAVDSTNGTITRGYDDLDRLARLCPRPRRTHPSPTATIRAAATMRRRSSSAPATR